MSNSESPIDLLILSNGPGEITTWVYPVVKELRQREYPNLRISVILAPCNHGTGKEAAIARSYPEVDRVQSAEHFLSFLLWGKTLENWDWHPQGIVIFLGGDQFFAVAIAKRFGYRLIVNAEWSARWYQWVDRFGVMNEQVLAKVPPQYRHKVTVIGDLMVDIAVEAPATESTEWIGILPGSKAMKLAQGLPLFCAIAQHIYTQRPQTRFLIPVAPTVDLETLAKFGDPQQNPLIKKLGNISLKLVQPIDGTRPYLQTSGGLKIELYQEFPAHHLLSKCRLCLTTIGANTAQLGTLAVPMLILLPVQQLDAMRAWDGLPGLLVNLPIFGTLFTKIINWFVWKYIVKTKRLYAWPNIWAKREIVPELIGEIKPEDVAKLALDWLENPQKLAEIQSNLRQVRGRGGATQKFVDIIAQEMAFKG